MSSTRFCNRPAVSIKTRSTFFSCARLMASKAKLAASAPSAPETTSAPKRAPHTRSCSTAAARNVSPAASNTVLPCSVHCAANFAIVVVLPEPLTPTIKTTNGFLLSSITKGLATGARTASTSLARIRRTSSGAISFS